MTAFRVVQLGRAPLVVAYLVGSDLDDRMRKALPGAAIVATAEAPVQGGDLAGARRLAAMPANAPVVLVGYSAGCQAVRAHLVAGVDAAAVVTIDGTHASKPPAAWQLDVWRTLAANARRGARLWVTTCCLQRYVEALPQPYLATSTVLSKVLGEQALATLPTSSLALDAYPGPRVWELHDHDLHVLAYGARNTDRAAHAAQQQIVLPEVLLNYVAPFLAASDADSEPTEIDLTRATPIDWSLDFGLAVLEVAKQDLNVGFREVGHNAGPDIERLYLSPLGLPPGSNYCAAAVASWIRRAEAITGMTSPIRGNPGAKATMAQFQQAGLWTPAAKMTHDDVYPGCCLVWDRSNAHDASTSWHGHIGIVLEVGDQVAFTVEANADRGGETTAVAMVERRLDDSRILGVGSFRNGVKRDAA